MSQSPVPTSTRNRKTMPTRKWVRGVGRWRKGFSSYGSGATAAHELAALTFCRAAPGAVLRFRKQPAGKHLHRICVAQQQGDNSWMICVLPSQRASHQVEPFKDTR